MAYDKQIAAITTYCEASNQQQETRRCVMHTFFNRMRLNPARYGRTVAAVCLKRYQYSEWNADAVDNANLERGANAPDGDPIMLECAALFDEAESGGIDPTGGATHYYDTSIAPPAWTIGAVRTNQSGSIIFYKDVK